LGRLTTQSIRCCNKPKFSSNDILNLLDGKVVPLRSYKTKNDIGIFDEITRQRTMLNSAKKSETWFVKDSVLGRGFYQHIGEKLKNRNIFLFPKEQLLASLPTPEKVERVLPQIQSSVNPGSEIRRLLKKKILTQSDLEAINQKKDEPSIRLATDNRQTYERRTTQEAKRENYYDRAIGQERMVSRGARTCEELRRAIQHRALRAHTRQRLLCICWRKGRGFPILPKKTGISRAYYSHVGMAHNDTLETKRKEFSMRYAIARREYTDLLFERAESQLFDDPDALAENLAWEAGYYGGSAYGIKLPSLQAWRLRWLEHRKGRALTMPARMISEAKARIASKIKESAIDVEICWRSERFLIC